MGRRYHHDINLLIYEEVLQFIVGLLSTVCNIMRIRMRAIETSVSKLFAIQTLHTGSLVRDSLLLFILLTKPNNNGRHERVRYISIADHFFIFIDFHCFHLFFQYYVLFLLCSFSAHILTQGKQIAAHSGLIQGFGTFPYVDKHKEKWMRLRIESPHVQGGLYDITYLKRGKIG